MCWFPTAGAERKKQLPSSFHNLHLRFVKETSLGKKELFPDLDQMVPLCDCFRLIKHHRAIRPICNHARLPEDIHARQENLPCRGDPILLQLPLAHDGSRVS